MLVLKINFWHQNGSEKVYFDGDSNQITIAGQNAPMSTELFHGMIAISGAITWQMKFKDNQVDVAEKQAPLLNCPDDDTEKLITFSRRVHKNLVKKLFNIN